MTVSAQDPRAPHVGTGSEDTFSYSCKIFQETDLLVYVDDVLQPYPTAYSVDMNSDGMGGNIIFEAAYIPTDKAVIDIVRSTPLTQETDLAEGDRFSAETIESTFDKLMMVLQDLDSKVSLLIADEGITPIPANTIYAMFPFEDVRKYASLNAAVTAIGSTPATLVVAGTQTLTASLTIPSTLRLVILKGGSIVKASTYTVTINGTFEAGLYTVFSGFSAGEVVFAANSVPVIHHQWFGETTGSHPKATAAGTTASIQVFCDYPSDTDITFTNVTTGNASASKHGFLPLLENSGSKFFKDDGTWATPGALSVVQVVNTQTGAVASGTTAIPADDTIPQKTEGDEYMTLAVTPTSATNKLMIEVECCLSPTGNSAMVAALFQDTTENALACVFKYIAANQYEIMTLRHYMVAGTVVATTFKVRAGSDAAVTTTFNGVAAARKYGGVLASSITITEIAV
jgi:hypothetical protein